VEEGKLPIMLIPVSDYRADLKVTNSKGNEVTVLSDIEFNRLYPDTPLDVLTLVLQDELKARLRRGDRELRQRDQAMVDKHRLIAIVLPESSVKDGTIYYEKIKMRWVEQFENQIPDGMYSKSVSIPIYISRFGEGESPAVYLSIKTNQKYEIQGQPRIRNLIQNPLEYRQIINDVRHKVYRFAPTIEMQVLRIRLRIGLPQLVKKWAEFGFTASIIASMVIVYFAIFNAKVPPFAYETLAGLIAFIVGLRVIVFHDLTLMEDWNRAHQKVVLLMGVILFSLMFIELNPNLLERLSNTIFPSPGKSVGMGGTDTLELGDEVTVVKNNSSLTFNTTGVAE
jgi:hypothetical protein